MNLRVTVVGKAKVFSTAAAAEASLNRAIKSAVVDAKPSDLHMTRVKFR